ncbi:MAG: hypothetical protein O7A04_07600 [Acidobacteria bacterium]|nr:hypothetical protein [Acidobacteriota bacterium]
MPETSQKKAEAPSFNKPRIKKKAARDFAADGAVLIKGAAGGANIKDAAGALLSAEAKKNQRTTLPEAHFSFLLSASKGGGAASSAAARDLMGE